MAGRLLSLHMDEFGLTNRKRMENFYLSPTLDVSMISIFSMLVEVDESSSLAILLQLEMTICWVCASSNS